MLCDICSVKYGLELLQTAVFDSFVLVIKIQLTFGHIVSHYACIENSCYGLGL